MIFTSIRSFRSSNDPAGKYMFEVNKKTIVLVEYVQSYQLRQVFALYVASAHTQPIKLQFLLLVLIM